MDGNNECNSWISQFWNAFTNVKQIYRCLRNFWRSYGQNIWYHGTSCRVKIARHAVHKLFENGKSRVYIDAEYQQCWILLRKTPGTTSYYVTTTAFLTHSFCYKQQNAQWSDEYSVHEKNPDIHLMCELQVTVKLYRAACSLSDADTQFFPNQKNSYSCSFLNVCTTAQEDIVTNVWLSN
jgi:hypothetical protein